MVLDLFSGAQREPAGCVIKVGVAQLESKISTPS